MLRSVALTTLLGACSVLAAKCSLTQKCPQDAPCCSQYGDCGVGAFCLGGCDPRMSYNLSSCVPAPVCSDKTAKFTNLDSIVDISKYYGDSTKKDWVAQGEPASKDGNVLLTMPKNSVGTVLASTSYMWYGNVKAKFKTSRGRGVVTAFILLSDVKDEIDYEFVGVDLETAQTNYYFQGIPDYHNSGNVSLSDTFHNFHEYEIRWTPDKIEWLVDGQVGRTKLRKDTWNETSQSWMYPQTPARVQLSIWPGGASTNAKGTVDWAGGPMDWDAEDIKNVGYFYATFSEVTMECYNAKSAPGTNSGKSYTYNSVKGTNDTVVDGKGDTVLGSFEGTGFNMMKDKASASQSADKPKNTAATIPGGSSGGTGQDHSGNSGSNSGSSSGGNSGGNSGGSGGNSGSGGSGSSSSSSGCAANTFNQDCGSGNSDQSGNGKNSGTRASASALAMVIAGCALFWL
ncbi:putative glycosidase CRH2 [Metarhizium acridum]|uniref:Crh-like protein n=1 Tax=Metarhizium acridum (strain CQMa 102) TaxID=655827 RepID=E9DVF1_METAQ|nr:cell wall glucanase (Utr2) [Metarhizium acridum CQMa 102]EFY92328.1 cell wall glucanase (Utr2) [Metarhizium acridum CQMa 102]KAG8424107.1 putative glycosidase CRH2 [Metarhizium acridum]